VSSLALAVKRVKTDPCIVQGRVAFSRDSTAEFVDFVEERNIHPPIAKTFGFGEVREAFAELENLNAVGKIVVKIT
jgi:D-arabinose 1-dehydrogenase-like Zn-dependent alcohol dehydrogenase